MEYLSWEMLRDIWCLVGASSIPTCLAQKNPSLKTHSVGKLRHWSWLGGGGNLCMGDREEKPASGCPCMAGSGRVGKGDNQKKKKPEFCGQARASSEQRGPWQLLGASPAARGDAFQHNTFFAWEGVGREGRCCEDLVCSPLGLQAKMP